MKIKAFEEFNPVYAIKLEQLNLLKPGETISKSVLESVLDKPYTEKDWEFLGPYLRLKSEIEEMGFFITQAGLEDPCFRILKTEEMAEYGMKKLVKSWISCNRVSQIMSIHKGDKLSEKEQKQFDVVQRKAAQMGLQYQKTLFGDFLLD